MPGQVQSVTIRQLVSNNFNRLLSKNHISGVDDALCFPSLLSKYLQFVLLLLGVETAQLPATTADVDNDTSSPHASFSGDAMTVHMPTQLLIDYLTKLDTAQENPIGMP